MQTVGCKFFRFFIMCIKHKRSDLMYDNNESYQRFLFLFILPNHLSKVWKVSRTVKLKLDARLPYLATNW